MCQLSDFYHLEMIEPWKTYLKDEFKLWHHTYLPQKGFKDGEDAWDLGAGCGETAQLFLYHGANHVNAVECDPGALSCLYANFGQDPRVTVIKSRVGFLKSDIEGAEWGGWVLEAHAAKPSWKPLFGWASGPNGIYRLEKGARGPRELAKGFLIWQGRKRREILGK